MGQIRACGCSRVTFNPHYKKKKEKKGSLKESASYTGQKKLLTFLQHSLDEKLLPCHYLPFKKKLTADSNIWPRSFWCHTLSATYLTFQAVVKSGFSSSRVHVISISSKTIEQETQRLVTICMQQPSLCTPLLPILPQSLTSTGCCISR